jgi:hypothetical protein
MIWSSLPSFVRALLRVAGGVLVLVAIYEIWQVSAPWRNRDAYNWTYTEAPDGHEQSLAIDAKESTMGGANGDTFTPTLSVLCEDGHPNVSLELGLSLCIGDCTNGAVYDVSEYFVSDPSAPSQFGASAVWHTTRASQAHATRFRSASEAGAAEDTPLVAPFVRKLAGAKEFWITTGSGEAKFDTAGLAAALPRLAKTCPALM